MDFQPYKTRQIIDPNQITIQFVSESNGGWNYVVQSRWPVSGWMKGNARDIEEKLRKTFIARLSEAPALTDRCRHIQLKDW